MKKEHRRNRRKCGKCTEESEGLLKRWRTRRVWPHMTLWSLSSAATCCLTRIMTLQRPHLKMSCNATLLMCIFTYICNCKCKQFPLLNISFFPPFLNFKTSQHWNTKLHRLCFCFLLFQQRINLNWAAVLFQMPVQMTPVSMEERVLSATVRFGVSACQHTRGTSVRLVSFFFLFFWSGSCFVSAV